MSSTRVADCNPSIEIPDKSNLTTARLFPEFCIRSLSLAPSLVLLAPFLKKLSALARIAPLTATLKLQLDMLPDASVAVHVTVVLPNEKDEPDGGMHTTVTPGQLSVAVAPS
jgi:hypothetical protein